MRNFILAQITLLIVFGSSLLISSYSTPSVVGLEVTNGTIENAHISDQQMKITFSRPMDKQSVEAAFLTDPTIAGNISWSQNTLFFTPQKPLNYDTTYDISVGDTAQDTYGKRITERYISSLTTEQGKFVFVGEEGQLYMSDLKENVRQITDDINLIQFFVSREAQQIVLLHYDQTTTLPRFSLLDLITKKTRPILNDFNGQIYFASYDETSNTLVFNFDDNTTAGYRKFIYTYNITRDELTKIDSNNLITFAFWLLPNSSTLLIQDLEARYFLYDMETTETQLIGTFIEYIASDSTQGTLYFRQSHETSQIVAVGVENREITRDDIVAALPTVNPENTLLAYAYKPKPNQLIEAEANFGLHILSVDSKEVISDIAAQDESLEYPTFSPNSQYLALTTTMRIQGEPSGFIIPSLRQRIGTSSIDQTIKVFDVENETFLDIQVEGSHVQWL